MISETREPDDCFIFVAKEEEYQKRTEIKISIPDVLKTQLVDDWEAVTKNMQVGVLLLPARSEMGKLNARPLLSSSNFLDTQTWI